MHCCKVNSRLLSRITPLIRRAQGNLSAPVTSEAEFNVQPETEVAVPALKDEARDSGIEYPPILDLSYPARMRRMRETWHNKIKHLSTVEEKIFELNMPRYYGWKLFRVEEDSLPYDPLPQVQYMTRTHLVSEPGLPAYYNDILSPEELDGLVQQIRSQVEDAVAFEFDYRKRDHQLSSEELEDKTFMDNLMTKSISQQINRILTINLSPKYSHLLEAQLDEEPRIEAFWFFGGFEAPSEAIKWREARHWTKEYKNDPTNEYIQYYGKPALQLRHNLPLKEITSLKESEDTALEIPVRAYDPRKLGYFHDRRRATIIPGFWPGDHNEFGLVSYHYRGHLRKRPECYHDELDAIKSQAILSSFSWLYGQACYQGFSTFQDPTYPLVNQSIITDGQSWSFAAYQLNTTVMHVDRINENPKRNMCWITEPLKLFEIIEDGKVRGLNDDVLKHLIKFYANAPQLKDGVEMKPYLGKEADYKVIADIEDPERRVWLEEKYKHLMSNRSRHLLAPEIYHWQYIYMKKFKTRHMERKLEPWQHGINVYQRRLDDHTPEYIPKCKRPHPRSRRMWAKTYYPTAPNDELLPRKYYVKPKIRDHRFAESLKTE